MALGWVAFVLIAVLFGVLRDLSEKRTLKNEHTLEYLVVRGFFLIPIYAIALFFLDINIKWQTFALVAGAAVLIATGIYLNSRSLKHLEISLVQPLLNFQPIFVLVLAFFLLGETITQLQFAGVLLLLVGAYVLSLDTRYHGIPGPIKKIFKSKYTRLMMLAVLIFAITAFIARKVLTTEVNAIEYLVMIGLIINPLFIAFHFFKYRFRNIKKVMKERGKEIIWPGLFRVGNLVAFYQALRIGDAAGLVVAISTAGTLISTMEGGILFHEEHLVQKGIACAVMVAGAIMVVL